MIFVVQDETKIPAGWLAKMAHLKAQLETLPDSAARKAFIKKHEGVWGEIKEQLLAMSHGKCWYSEAPDAVSDWHVDHFRPKGRALDEDGTEHEGYQWLAFDWKNYRIAGSYPNSPHKDAQGRTRGKWDHFPLAGGCKRADWGNRDCSSEICLILDPATPTDPKLMNFDEKGLPIPSAPGNPIIRRRVEVTVNYLHLDQPKLVRARKQKWREVRDWIEEFLKACPSDLTKCMPGDYQRLERVISKLSALARPDSSYAATARACLRANELEWVIDLAMPLPRPTHPSIASHPGSPQPHPAPAASG
jgi:uncharacterized protein (TIGR02646 family)